MATSLAGSSRERTNYSRLTRLLVDEGTRILKEHFDVIHAPHKLHGVLHSGWVHSKLKSLKAKKILSTFQWKKLYPPMASPVTSESFDITLLLLLLREICNLTAPGTGWDKPPVATDYCKEADFVRLRLLRNKCYGHVLQASFSDADFETCWDEISEVLLRLGGTKYQAEIERLKIESMDLDDEIYYMDILKECELHEKTLMGLIVESEERLTRKLKQHFEETQASGICEIKEHISETVSSSQVTVTPFSDDDAQRLSDDMKKNILVQTKIQPGLFRVAGSECKMDEIFTNIMIQKGRKSLRDQRGHTRRENIFERYEDIFIDSDTKELHKSVFITGNPGIGKTFFCLKMLRDWASGTLFTSFQYDFKFAFYITFRQLNLYEKEQISLVDILRRSCVDIDETAFCYIKQHSNHVLFILDGFDEFKNHQSIADMEDAKYANDPLEKMPVSYLISKLMKKKILAESVVLVTSRPTDEKTITFDMQAEIVGFNELQVKEYIEKYFKDDRNMTDKVINHVLDSKQLVSFSYTPLNCQLMCWCLHHFYRKEDNVCNESAHPFTETDLYLLLTDILLSKLHPDSEFRFQPISDVDEVKPLIVNTLDKLYKLAGNLYLKRELVFNDSDLKEFNFLDEEITEVKNCGLIICGPGYSDQTGRRVTHDYCFLHLTLQEFFAAHFFVKTGDIPRVSDQDEVVCKFIAGLAGKEKNEECMRKLMEWVHLSAKVKYQEDERKWHLPNVCLQACDDDEFAKKFVLKLVQECGLYESHKIRFVIIGYFKKDIFPKYLISLISLYNEEISSTKEKDQMIQCALKIHADEQMSETCDLFTKIHCNLTDVHCEGEFSCKDVDAFCHLLNRNPNVATLTFTNFYYSTDDFPFDSFWQAIKQCSHLTDLSFKQYKTLQFHGHPFKKFECSLFNEGIIDVIDGGKLTNVKLLYLFDFFVYDFCKALNEKCIMVSSLYLRFDATMNIFNYFAKAVECLCNVIRSPECGLNKLSLFGHFDDASLASLWQTLKDASHSLRSLTLESDSSPLFNVDLPCEVLANSKLTSLVLKRIHVTDENVMRLIHALDNSDCQLTTLKLDCSISERCVGVLCDVLEKGNSQLTQISLRLQQDESYYKRVCQTIKHRNCKLESLKIVFDVGGQFGKAFSWCVMLVHAFQSENCGLKRLVIKLIQPDTNVENHTFVVYAMMEHLSKSLSNDLCYEFVNNNWIYFKYHQIDIRKKMTNLNPGMCE